LGEPVAVDSDSSTLYDSKPMEEKSAGDEDSADDAPWLAVLLESSTVVLTGTSSIRSMSASSSSNCRRVGCKDGDDEVGVDMPKPPCFGIERV
jgi:hypothetical protein